MTHPEFRRYVTEVHGPLVKSVTAVAADIHHYHYNFPVPDAVDAAFGHPSGGRTGHRHRGLVRSVQLRRTTCGDRATWRYCVR